MITARDKTNEYNAVNGLYCVMNVNPPYSIGKVIGILRERQRSARQAYEQQMKEWDAEEEKKIDDTVGPCADAFAMHAKGKVTSSGKGLGR
jgi:hypothetical protein